MRPREPAGAGRVGRGDASIPDEVVQPTSSVRIPPFFSDATPAQNQAMAMSTTQAAGPGRGTTVVGRIPVRQGDPG